MGALKGLRAEAVGVQLSHAEIVCLGNRPGLGPKLGSTSLDLFVSFFLWAWGSETEMARKVPGSFMVINMTFSIFPEGYTIKSKSS